MGQIKGLPLAVVIGQRRNREKIAGFLKFPRPAIAEAEVSCGVICMTEVKAPPEVER